MEFREVEIDASSVRMVAIHDRGHYGYPRADVEYFARTKDGKAIVYLGVEGDPWTDRQIKIEEQHANSGGKEFYKSFAVSGDDATHKAVMRELSSADDGYSKFTSVPAQTLVDEAQEGVWFWYAGIERIEF